MKTNNMSIIWFYIFICLLEQAEGMSNFELKLFYSKGLFFYTFLYTYYDFLTLFTYFSLVTPFERGNVITQYENSEFEIKIRFL